MFRESKESLKFKIIKGEIDWGENEWQKISFSVKDLVKKMLHVDPLERISVDAIFEHEWLKKVFYLKKKKIQKSLIRFLGF